VARIPSWLRNSNGRDVVCNSNADVHMPVPFAMGN
jgi:hypothetical protein